MDRVELKSPGILIDELITVMIKKHIVLSGLGQVKTGLDELEEKELSLQSAITRQLGLVDVAEFIGSLIRADIECFFAQEKLFECDKNGDKVGAGEAAIKVQRLNNERNKAMIAVDDVLGFGKIALTRKTYDGK